MGEDGDRPLWMRIAGIAGAAIFLIGFFMYIRFPYDRLGDLLALRVEQETGMRITFAEIGASPQWLGPGIAVEGVRLTRRDGRTYPLDRIVVRPAWATSWFWGRPALYTRFGGPLGAGAGTLTLNPPAFSGEIDQVDLGALLENDLGPDTAIDGTVDVNIDLGVPPEGPVGPVQFVAREGSVTHPQLPLSIPYEEANGSLEFGGSQRLEIVALDIDSPMLTGKVTGTVGKAGSFERSPLALNVQLTAAPQIRGALNAQGVRLGRDGSLNVRVMGTPASPIVR
jgi:type II secretion system protein N